MSTPTDQAKARNAFKISEFCDRNSIGLATYHKLKRRGLGPREMRLGAAIRVTLGAERDWQTARENPAPAEAKALEAEAEERRERAKRAGDLAAQSTRHISRTRPRAAKG